MSLRHPLISLTEIWRRTAEMGAPDILSPPFPSAKGRHLRNILRKLKGSLLTAVAIVYSISMTWNFSLPDTDVNMSKTSCVDVLSGTLILSRGRLDLIVPVVIRL